MKKQSGVTFSTAKASELDEIVAMIADDDLGVQREKYISPLPDSYMMAFTTITNDPNAYLIIAKHDCKIIGVAQVNIITYLTYQGGKRAQIEGVRIRKEYRNQGVGKDLFVYLINFSRKVGCHLVQLTTDKQRKDAYKFYENLGFIHSHHGFKLHFS